MRLLDLLVAIAPIPLGLTAALCVAVAFIEPHHTPPPIRERPLPR